ncbi:MAG: glycerol-3-phosphate 1-O-acyltransferase PlsY [Limisphaerales bacterium]
MPTWSYIIVAVAAYLLGSIPTGYLIGKAKGIDIRKSGSGNIGATNSYRVLGKPAGIFVLLADCAKGFVAVCVCNLILKMFNMPDAGVEAHRIVAGIFAVLGHNYTCWLKFKGGKGIATTAGVYLALAPVALGIALALFILAVLTTRYVSVGSIVAAIVLPIAVWFTAENLFLRIVTIALGAMAIYKHRGNIRRLLNGTESHIGKKSQPEAAK